MASESLLKMMKSAFYLILKLSSILRYLIFCPDIFGHVGKRLDEKAKANFKIYDVINFETNSYNTYCSISQEEKTVKQ